MDVENLLPGLDTEAHQKITATVQELSAQRKSRTESTTLAKEDELKQFHVLSSHPVHKTTAPGILCVDIHPSKQVRLVIVSV